MGRRRPPPRHRGRPGGGLPKRVLNQNLLYLVFKCLLSTKNSGSDRSSQAKFHAQGGAGKRARKTGRCGRPTGMYRGHPPVVHPLVHHGSVSDERRTDRCGFATVKTYVAAQNETASRIHGRRSGPARRRALGTMHRPSTIAAIPTLSTPLRSAYPRVMHRGDRPVPVSSPP